MKPAIRKKAKERPTPAAYTGGFRRGNTPYVLVRALFVPEQEYFAEGNTKTNEGEDFYLGTTTNKLYSSKENVTDPTKGGLKGQKYHKYEKGKVLYYAFVNPDVVGKTLDAPAFRNNVYHINITGFKEIGLNWNPLYPEDPNTDDPKNPDPKPKDPNEDPNTPIDPNDPNSPSDTYMSVTVQVLKWNVHSYDIDLGL
ncbi:Mfa1 family fimbria major subunit [Porphyromonas crevioricanis]|uniref:Mfa1 family fimbria major subunit n=1 Tax=Porphyromonas crevioricanis TaxID=393921 RepID=UPI001364024F|nr:Mfa1 family fimbria major subunit [Porphyromonas crevioricanis]